MNNKQKEYCPYPGFWEDLESLTIKQDNIMLHAMGKYGRNREETDLDNPMLCRVWKGMKSILDSVYTNSSVCNAMHGDNVNANGNVSSKEDIDTKVSSFSVTADSPYSKYLEWRKVACPHLSKMQEMFEKEFMTVISVYGKKAVFDTLVKMENYKDTAKKNRTIYHTLRNWLNRDKDYKNVGYKNYD